MEICVKSFDGEKYTVDVGVDDTIADIRQKVASAAELCEDGFDMSFGGKLLAEGDDTTQLSAGDTVVLTKTKSQKDDAIAALRDLGETRLTSERFEGLTDRRLVQIDPKLVHLFLKAEVVTEIFDGFLEGGTFEELDLSGVTGVTKIRRNFLIGCSSLHTADLSGWSNVTHIDGDFLERCMALQTLDLSGWGNVTHVDNGFLQSSPVQSSALRTLDLSGWSNVTRIESSFLCYCRELTTLDISGWSNMTHIEHGFLYNCSALRTLDMSGWTNVTQLGCSFLSHCGALQTVDLSGWNNVTQIEDFFLANCKALTALRISGWNVRHVGASFLANLSALKTLDMSGWSSVQHIENGFLEGCTIPTSSINVTGSSSVVSEHVHSVLMDDEASDVVQRPDLKKTKRKCVCM